MHAEPGSRTAEPPKRSMERWPRQLWRPWLAAALGVACYLNSLPNGFTYDDKEIVRDNPDLRSLANVRAIWLGEWWSSRGARAASADPSRDRLYRPLTMQTFALNYAASSASAGGQPPPFGLHLVNVLLHGLVCLLVWRLGERLTGDATVAGVAACIFAVHPIHAEAVANIVGRAELLAAAWLVGGLLFLLPPAARAGLPPTEVRNAKSGRMRWRTALAAGCFLLALFSKESAICYPALAALVLIFSPRETVSVKPRRANALVTALILAVPLAIYFPLRYFALDGAILRSGPPNGIFNPLVDATAWGRILGPLTVLSHYVRLMLFPWQLSSDYGRDVMAPDRADPVTWLGALAFLALLITAGLLLRSHSRNAPIRRTAGLLAALFIASCALISNTVVLTGVSLAERLFYFPSLLASLLVVCVLVVAGRRRTTSGSLNRIRARVAVLVIALLAARTLARNPDWHDDRALTERDVATYPQSANLQCFAGRSLLEAADAATTPPERRRLLALADRRLEQSLRIVFRNPYALHMRARVRFGLLDYPAARAYIELAVRFHPHDAQALAFLARVKAAYTGDADLRTKFAAELQRYPADPVLHQRLGETLYRLGAADAALLALRRAIELDPEETEALRLIGEVLASQGKTAEALETLRTALQRDPHNWLTHLNLSAVLAADAPRDALAHARAAQRLRPDEFAADANVAEALLINGLPAEAVAHYRRLLANLAPADPQRAFVEQRIRELSPVEPPVPGRTP